ncbi:MAG: DUF1289 domain-containing protein [Burkholderiales bacterium]|nr:MAG: DUF1289 domain-containing protein [Burkholderiales bacterium]
MSKLDAPPSPCVRNCCLDQNDICLGCGRSIEEITRWGNASAEEKQEILEKARQRQEKRPYRP